MDLNQLKNDLQQGEDVKVTPDGQLVSKDSSQPGTYVKPNTWA